MWIKLSMTDKTRKLCVATVLAVAMCCPACAWQRIPPTPSLEPGTPLPLTVAVQFRCSKAQEAAGDVGGLGMETTRMRNIQIDSTVTTLNVDAFGGMDAAAFSLPAPTCTGVYGPIVVDLLSRMSIVDRLIYPYQEGDEVDATLIIEIDGAWKSDVLKDMGVAVLHAWTLYTLTPVIGRHMVGTHNLGVTLNKSYEVARYSSQIVSKVTWGLGADILEVNKKSDALQVRKIAVEIGEWLQTNRSGIIEQLGGR